MVRITGIEACIFDAYGTLFDVASAATHASDALGEKRQPLAELWRMKQLQYTWLRSLMGRHADFWQVTGDALDYPLASMKLADPELRERLMARSTALPSHPTGCASSRPTPGTFDTTAISQKSPVLAVYQEGKLTPAANAGADLAAC
jgi:2-haloacid dehalogenase